MYLGEVQALMGTFYRYKLFSLASLCQYVPRGNDKHDMAFLWQIISLKKSIFGKGTAVDKILFGIILNATSMVSNVSGFNGHLAKGWYFFFGEGITFLLYLPSFPKVSLSRITSQIFFWSHTFSIRKPVVEYMPPLKKCPLLFRRMTFLAWVWWPSLFLSVVSTAVISSIILFLATSYCLTLIANVFDKKSKTQINILRIIFYSFKKQK